MGLEELIVLTSALLVGSVLASKVSSRLGLPALLLFLGLGMAMGSDGPGGVWFDDPALAQNCAVVALVLILFSGGLDTDWGRVRPVLGQALSLATLGVLITAGVVAVAARLMGLSWLEGWLLGAIVGSTDAAAVFSVLRSRGLALREGADRLLELESGCNDPMAVFLTLAFTSLLAQPDLGLLAIVPLFFQQMALGGALGLGFGLAGSLLAARVRLEHEGLYGPLFLAWAFLAFGATALAGGSGFLAVYLVGLVLGNRPLVHRESMRAFFDGLAWLMQIAMFLGLGLLVFPTRLAEAAGAGLLLALVLVLLARPVAVFVSLAASRSSVRQKLFVSWVGLRGAVPIILATWPVLADLPGADRMFHVVFFVVLVSVALQGTTLEAAARRLRLVE